MTTVNQDAPVYCSGFVTGSWSLTSAILLPCVLLNLLALRSYLGLFYSIGQILYSEASHGESLIKSGSAQRRKAGPARESHGNIRGEGARNQACGSEGLGLISSFGFGSLPPKPRTGLLGDSHQL